MACSFSRCAAALLLLGLCATAARADDTTPGVSGEHDFNLYCASCHGVSAKGDGPKAFSLEKKPPNLTTLTEKYGQFPRDKLTRMIDGRDPVPGHGVREMPVWGVWFKEEAAQELGGAEGDEGSVKRRLDNLVDYIASLQNVK
jgi:mono/diheme cytochrome c family protein